MNENNLDNKENDVVNCSSLKNENEDNIIENVSKIKKIVGFEEEKIFNTTSKYKLDYAGLIKYINKFEQKDLYDQNEYFCNLLLMPKEINIKDKIITLYNLSKISQKTDKKELLIRIVIKFGKILKNQNNIDIKYYMNSYSKVAKILCEDYQNYFYAYKFIKKSSILVNNSKNYSSESDDIQIATNFSLITQKTSEYLSEKKSLFSDESAKEKIKQINELTSSILDNKNNTETDENDENKKYLYVINKEWLYNLIQFINPLIVSLSNDQNIDNSIQKSFELEYIYELYIDEKEKENSQPDKAFPGPIDNFKITSFKDSWKDNENLDENDYIKKKAEYYLVNYEDWTFLNSFFGHTNILRRKKEYLDYISFQFILFDKRIKIKEQNLHLLKERYIQVNKHINIKKLKEKILRCIDNELKPNEKEKQICFFILDRDKSDILIEATFGYISKIKMYESFFIKKIEFQDEDNLDKFFSEFDKNKHILLVEILQDGEMNFLFQIEKDKNKCTICEKKIKDEKDIYKCEICHFSLFCSKACAYNSDDHRLLDVKVKNLKTEQYNIKDILSYKHNYNLMAGNQGRVTISIDGEDESFFTSAIHCLSNTLALTKYFLIKRYEDEKKEGYKKYFTDIYYKLIKALWDYGSHNISMKIESFCKNIGLTNLKNADPCDFIYKLLDKLNEELNKASGDYNKDIEEQKEGESDEETSKRFLSNFKKKKNSVITDLFMGQYKESIKCIFCGTKYIKFPHFFSLGIPMPDKKSNIQIKLFTKNSNFYYINIKVNENSEMKDFLFKAIEYLNKKTYINHLLNTKTEDGIFNYNITEVPEKYLYNSLQFVEVNKDFKIVKVYKTSYINCPTGKDNKKNLYYNSKYKNSFDTLKYKDYKNTLDKKNPTELIIIEKGINSSKADSIPFYVYALTEVEKETMFYGIKKSHKILSYPVVLLTNKNETLDDLKTKIFLKFQKTLVNHMKDDLNSIDIYYPHFSQGWENPKVKDPKCPICLKNISKSFCCCLAESMDKSTTVEKLLEKQEKDRPLILYAKSFLYDKKKYIYKGMELFYEKNNEIETKENFSLFDSLDCFNVAKTSEEKFFCKHCNDNRPFKKEINLYSLPIYLILQIKKGKSDKYIEYKENIDLKEYIINPNKTNSIYDLYAVILQKKSLNSCYYLSYCKNFDRWISYDIEGIDLANNIINKDAYILFYKRSDVE